MRRLAIGLTATNVTAQHDEKPDSEARDGMSDTCVFGIMLCDALAGCSVEACRVTYHVREEVVLNRRISRLVPERPCAPPMSA